MRPKEVEGEDRREGREKKRKNDRKRKTETDVEDNFSDRVRGLLE